MKLKKPKFWDEEIGFISILLFPLSIIIKIIIFFKRKLIKAREFNIPIICIGNIYLGGTGKTPLSIFIGNQLIKNKKKPIIIRKYYKSHEDEYELIKSNFKNLLINKNRINAIDEAIKRDFNFVILDDGFQDLKIKKNLNIICFNQKQLIGNGLTIPSGPLRENLSSLKKADVIVINGQQDKVFEEKILSYNKNLKIYYSQYKATNILDFKEKKLLALAGIGNPDNFFDLLYKNKLRVEKKLVFPDHYEFNKKDVLQILDDAKNNNLEIITTEKDYYRLKKYNIKQIAYLKIELIIEEMEKLNRIILELND